MTTYKGFAPKTSELATADNAAITVKAVSPAPIAADLSSQWEAFTARPVVAAGIAAMTKTKDGFLTIAAEEKEFEYGRSFIKWLWNVFTTLTVPVLALLWLAINKGYVWSRKPETRAAAAAKWQSLKTWAAPKFDYETEADR